MIAGVGPALIDYICLIDEYPEKGGHAVVNRRVKMAGGAASNVLYGLSKFGLRCRFYSTIGADSNADFFIKSMKEIKVDLRLNVTHPETGRVDVYIDSEGERTFFVHPNAAGIVEVALDYDDYKESDYFYLDPFPADDSFDLHLEVAQKAKAFSKKVILNPGYSYAISGFGKIRDILRYVDIMFISEQEYRFFEGHEKEILELIELLVVTMGERGSRTISEEGVVYREVEKVKAVDTTGAGDAFAAGFLFAYMNNKPLGVCLDAGNFVASYSIQHFGAKNFPMKEEIEMIVFESFNQTS